MRAAPRAEWAARIEAIGKFHKDWHAKQIVSFESTCEACFLLAAIEQARREEREACAVFIERAISHDIAAFNAGRSEEPGWTASLVERCEPVFRHLAAAIRARAKESDRG